MATIHLDSVTKVFPGGVVAVDDVSLSIGDGEFIVLVGPSGCGKSTLLRMLAGLEESSDGRILIDGREVTDLAPRHRDVAMVFQSYALYPHMTVRENLGYGLAQLHARLGVTTVYVTHDQTEAMTLGQRVAVMRDGRILQVDAPQRLYGEPRNLFVAAFIGSPAMNLVEATVDGGHVTFGGLRIPLGPRRRPAGGAPGRVVLGIRPESFEDDAFAQPDLPRIDVQVEVLEELGSDAHVIFGVDALPVSAELLEVAQEDTSLLAEETSLFNARVDPRTRARVGGPLRLAVDPARFHFFDLGSGESLLAAAAERENVPDQALRVSG